MKFYKVHSAKFKNDKVIFVPEQFDQIGPDAFLQTNFDIIVLSRRVKSISAHAFSSLKRCKVYIHKNTTDIDSMAFDDMDIGNVFYCERDCVAYNMCIERGLSVNEDIEEFLSYAENLKSEQNAFKGKMQSARPVTKKAEPITTAPFNKIPATEPIPREPSQSKSEPTEKKGIEDFEAEFGFAPIVDYFSPLEAHWREKIEAMDSFEIISVYDHGDYCEHYRYLCYMELKKRFLEGKINMDYYERELQSAYEMVQEDDDKPDSADAPIDDISALLGAMPIYSVASGRADSWKAQLKELTTEEILDRYYSEDYCEEYRYLCYEELMSRDDTMEILFSN